MQLKSEVLNDGYEASSSTDGAAADAAVARRWAMVPHGLRRRSGEPVARRRTTPAGAVLLGGSRSCCGGCSCCQVRRLRYGDVWRQSSRCDELGHGRLHTAIPIDFQLCKLQATVHGCYWSVLSSLHAFTWLNFRNYALYYRDILTSQTIFIASKHGNIAKTF